MMLVAYSGVKQTMVEKSVCLLMSKCAFHGNAHAHVIKSNSSNYKETTKK